MPGGPSLRLSGAGDGPVVVLFGGSSARDVPGVWSPTTEWLARRLIRRRPGLRAVEVRYRHSSWRRLGEGVADGAAALESVQDRLAPERIVLVGFSFGGAVAVSLADRPRVAGVVGLAAWLPGGLDLATLRGRWLRLLHGTLDGGLPGIPGVSPSISREALGRARRLGIDAELTLIPGGLHGLAVRSPWGAAIGLPRAHRWLGLVDHALG